MPEIKYPRNRFLRGSLQLLGRTVMRILTRPRIEGYQNYPKSGGLIIVANHSGLLETVMMTCFAPRQVEYMGSVDIPHEKLLYAFMNAYRFIPVFRGNVSVSAMKDGVSVLKQGGVIGIFPEGGIWEPAIRKAQSGVAFMSYHGQAPILPIGFKPTAGALGQALSFKRPPVEMRIGELIPPVSLQKERPKKDQFQEAAQMIMDTVWELVPQDEGETHLTLEYEHFSFRANAFSADGSQIKIPRQLALVNGASLSKILYRTTLINNFRDNLKIDITPIKNLDQNPSPDAIIASTSQILNYITKENPWYFTYRYGQREGSQMGQSIHEFHNFAAWAKENNYRIEAVPIRKYKYKGCDEVIQTKPTELAKW